MKLRDIRRRTMRMLCSTEVVTVRTNDIYLALAASLPGRDHDKVLRAVRAYVKASKGEG